MHDTTWIWLAALALATSADAQTDDDWRALDAEVVALSLAHARADDGAPELGGYLKTSYRHSDDPVYSFDPEATTDPGSMGGFRFDNVSLQVTGDAGPFGYKVSYNPDRDRLRTVYARFRPVDPVRVTIGRFKAPVLRSRLVSTTRLLFPDRTALARITGPRDLGVKVEVDVVEDVRWLAALQNGEDDVADELFASTRLEVDLLGGGAASYEGAWKGDEEVELTFGLAASDDGTVPDGRVLAADLAATKGRLYLAGEVVDNGADLPDVDLDIVDPASPIERADTTPWGATASWMFGDRDLELAVRLEEFDDDANTRRFGAGLNWYQDGHDAKWHLGWQRVSSDVPGLESDVLLVGFVLDF